MKRWGTTIRITKALREGLAGVAALPLCQPFATWVAKGVRQTKYLNYKTGDHRLFYLYATAGKAPEAWFDHDYDEEHFRQPDAAPGEVEATVKARIERDSRVRAAIVGVGLLVERDEEEIEEGIFPFEGGVLFDEPIPLDALAQRPYGGLFYPFGAEAARS